MVRRDNTGEVEEKPVRRHPKWRRFRNITFIVLAVGLVLFFLIRFYYPFGEGVKTGQLNYVVYKGVVFKTYEGKLVQSGFQSDASGGLQSNQFVFSVADKDVAEKLMHAGGQIVELHYKEYFGALPWRGYSKYIVDEILNISPAGSASSMPPVNISQ
ncbi:MAG: hypothetical protein LUD76_11250 [Alistipes sp.]|nr:hypothetical protein [Alistipes sp.]